MVSIKQYLHLTVVSMDIFSSGKKKFFDILKIHFNLCIMNKEVFTPRIIIMPPKDVDENENREDRDQTAPL